MDEPAITPIRKKRRSSIRICAELVKEGRAQAMVTAGNTGAAMISAKMVIGTVAGVDRPALAAVLPNAKGRTVLLDVGANVDTKPIHLREFAVMGHFYAQEVIGTPSPRVGLMSIGEEEGKGTDLTREVFKVLKNTGLNFVGNVEGRDVFNGSRGRDRLRRLRRQRDPEERRGAGRDDRPHAARGDRAQRPHQDGLPARQARLRRASASAPTTREFGAAPLLGVNGGCFIGHGRSNAHAIQNAIRRAVEFSAAQLDQKIRDKIAELHSQEERLLGGHPETTAADEREG